MSGRRRRYVFTLNNYTADDESRIGTVFDTRCRYGVYGREIGATGTPHLQGFLIFKESTRFNAVKELLGDRCHIEGANGSNDQASEYCKKDGDFVESGQIPNERGARTDLYEAIEFLTESRDMVAFKREYPREYIKYPRGFSTLLSYPAREPGNPPYVHWIFGRSGVGKTRYVFARESGVPIWTSIGDLSWFEGYYQQPVALLDDFRGSNCKFSYLLRLLDRYPFTVEYKGGSIPFNSSRIYITSCHAPSTVYDKLPEDVFQLIRRVSVVTHMVTPFTGQEDYDIDSQRWVWESQGEFDETVPSYVPSEHRI
jgi:hypothetical protein